MVVDGEVKAAKLSRKPGDALCRVRVKFWGLYDDRGADVGDEISCAICAKRYERLVRMRVLEPHEGKTRSAVK